MEHSRVQIQISPDSLPSMPSWFGEVVVFAHCLTHEGILKAIREQVRFARARMGTYELIDFVAVVIGYVLSSEPTLQAFYERLAPFAEPFMSLFERERVTPIAQPFPGISLLSTSPRWRSCARFFKRICWLAPHLLLPAVCSTGRGDNGW